MANVNIKNWALYRQFLEAPRAKQFDSHKRGFFKFAERNRRTGYHFMKLLLGAVKIKNNMS